MKKLTLLTAMLFAVLISSAQIIHIPDDYPTIQQGIDLANNGDTILVETGIYNENINFNGKNITVASLFLTTDDTSYISQTVINGNNDGSVVTFSNEEDSTTLFCGFTLLNGYVQGNGGGINCSGSNPVLSNLLITNCTATAYWGGYGGGIYCLNSSLTLINSVIKNCNSNYGGGIYMYHSNPILKEIQIINNMVFGGSGGGYGGGIDCRGYTRAHLEDVIICGNSATNGGGIYWATDTTSFFNNVSVVKNTAKNMGGGIYICDIGPVFDENNRCNIYLNTSAIGNDLYSENNNIEIVLDTFSVMFPTDYHAEPLQYFNLNFINGFTTQVDADVFVSPNGDDTNSGLSEDDPFKTIHYAFSVLLADSIHQPTIHLMDGVYSDSSNAEIFPINIIDFVSLNGKSDQTTILDANGYAGVMRIDKNSTNTISNLKLTGGYADQGGGLFCAESSPQLINLSVSGNEAIYQYYNFSSGGGIYFIQSNPILNNVKIENNLSWGYPGRGGGITLHESTAVFDNISIFNNEATGSSYYDNYSKGGGIYCNNSVISLNNGTIADNKTTNGGGIYAEGISTVSLQEIVFENDSANFGGAIYSADSASFILTSSFIRNNQAEKGGGIYWASDISATFDNDERTNIYFNEAFTGNDLYAEKFCNVVLDTFSVLYPTEFYVHPIEMFNFDILNGKSEQAEADLFVSPAGDNSNDGLTVEKPLKTIHFALAKIFADSLNPRTIYLTEGTYSPSTNGEDIPINMPNYVNLSGESDSIVIINAEENNNGILFYENNTSTLSGITVKGSSQYGIYCLNASPTLENISVTDNKQGIECDKSSPEIRNSIIYGNWERGLIVSDSSNPHIQNVVISENANGGVFISDYSAPFFEDVSIIKNTTWNGAGIYCSNSDPVLKNVIISENEGGYGGGLSFNGNSSPRLTNVTITNNIGNGIYFNGTSMIMKDGIVSGNTGGGIGLAAFDTAQTSVIENVTVSANSSSRAAGLYIDSDVLLKNVLIKDNIAGNGGGIYCQSSKTELSGTTIINNHAQYGGGGIVVNDGAELVFDSINRCNIYLNTALYGRDLFSQNKFVEVYADTFTVMHPNELYADRINNFSFDILHGLFETINADLYISPDGDNLNSGLTESEPLKNIFHAFPIIVADSMNLNKIHLADGTYSFSGSGEVFPINLPGYMSLVGSSPDNVILDAEETGNVIEINNNEYNLLSGLTIKGAHGSGIDCNDSKPVLQNLVITENAIGISIDYSNPILENIKITSNSGRGVNCYSSGALLQDVYIADNNSERGAGMYMINDTNTIIRNTVFENNTAETRGGGIYCEESLLRMENVTFNNNTAMYGGGIFFTMSKPILTNVLFTDNIAERYGGGLFGYMSDASLRNLTFSKNIALEEGGGIWCQKSETSLLNTVMWNDEPEEIFLNKMYFNTISVSWSDIQGGKEGIKAFNNDTIYWLDGNLDVDPAFVTEGDFPYNLSAISPCINAGIPDTIGLNLPDFDFLGNPRIWDGRIDMGAVEWNSLGEDEFEDSPQSSTVLIYPNPFTNSTTIEYQLEKSSNIQLVIYNHLGEKVEQRTEYQSQGKQQFTWHAENIPAGIYYCVLKTEYGTQTTKMIKLK